MPKIVARRAGLTLDVAARLVECGAKYLALYLVAQSASGVESRRAAFTEVIEGAKRARTRPTLDGMLRGIQRQYATSDSEIERVLEREVFSSWVYAQWNAACGAYNRAQAQKRRKAVKRSDEHFAPQDVERLMRAQRRRCHYCRAPLTAHDYEVDHVVPLKRGGDNSPANIVLACQPCNGSKGSKTLDEWEGRKGISAAARERLRTLR